MEIVRHAWALQYLKGSSLWPKVNVTKAQSTRQKRGNKKSDC